jgi:hypothetical protein
MQTALEDRLGIAELMTGWIHRLRSTANLSKSTRANTRRCLSLAKGGFPVKRVFATTGSGVEMTTKADGQACWRLDAASRISIPTVRLLVSR